MPKKAASHIQKRAPGPPSLMAVATPTMLPVPTVAARAVQRALKESMSPSPLFRAKKMSVSARGSFMTCRKPSRQDRNTPVPTRRMRSQGPHTILSIWFNTSTNIKTSPESFRFTTPHTTMSCFPTHNKTAGSVKQNRAGGHHAESPPGSVLLPERLQPETRPVHLRRPGMPGALQSFVRM